MMFEADSRAAYLSKYLKTDTARMLATWDDGAEPSLSRVDVYCILGWVDAARALAAAQLIDREMRRGASAYSLAYGPPHARRATDSNAVRFLQQLGESPSPHHTNRSGLRIADVDGPPMALRLEPTGDVVDALAHAGNSMAGYVLAGFGKRFAVEWFGGHNFQDSDFDLGSARAVVERGYPVFDVTSHGECRSQDLEQSSYQYVSSPPLDQSLGFEVHLVILRAWSDRIDLVHAWC